MRWSRMRCGKSFARRARVTPDAPPSLPVFRGSRLAPGVDLDDSAALLDMMERAEP